MAGETVFGTTVLGRSATVHMVSRGVVRDDEDVAVRVVVRPGHVRHLDRRERHHEQRNNPRRP